MSFNKRALSLITISVCLFFLNSCSGGGGGSSDDANASSTASTSTASQDSQNYQDSEDSTDIPAAPGCTGSSPTWTSTPDYAAVSSCVSKASSGDTINVTVGTADWGSNMLSISKAVKLIGAGSKSTIISGTGTLFSASTGSSASSFALRISGFKFTTTGSSIAMIQGSGKDWRIDNNIFEKSAPKASFLVYSANGGGTWTLFGIIDNNVFNHISIDVAGSTEAANDSWISAAQWGTANAVFIENNTFYMQDTCGTAFNNSIDSNNGARAVIRYNNFYDAYIMAHSACQQSVRGTRSYEVYNNVFRRTCADFGGYVFLRAGSHVITDNLVSGKWSPYDGAAMIDNRRSWFDSSCVSSSGFGNCDGSNAYDTNISNPAHSGAIDGYRCLDQPGAGTGAIGSQTADPIYIWNNIAGKNCLGGSNKWGACTSDSNCPGSTCSTATLNPQNVYLHNDGGYQVYHIVANRDFYAGTARSGYTKYRCPHPVTGLTGLCTSTAGSAGYNK